MCTKANAALLPVPKRPGLLPFTSVTTVAYPIGQSSHRWAQRVLMAEDFCQVSCLAPRPTIQILWKCFLL